MGNKRKTTTAMLRLCAAALIGSFLLTACPAGVSKIKHKVTFAVDDGNGRINAKIDGNDITSNSMVENGKIISFTAIPNANYKTENWTITGGKTVSGEDTGTSTITVPVIADTTVTVSFKQNTRHLEQEPPKTPPLQEQETSPPAPPFNDSTEERNNILFKRLINAALRFEKDADVSELNISSAKQMGGGEYIRLYNEFLKAYPFVFHLTEDGSISYNYKPENENELAKYIFDYRIHFDFENYYKNFEAALEDFYGRLREGMSDAEIAYILHSALAEKNVYGFGMHASDTLGTVMKGRAICQGYSLIYRRLLLGVGNKRRICIRAFEQ